MPRPFSPATAEQVIGAVDAVLACQQNASVDVVADFLDLPKDPTESALKLAADIGLLGEANNLYFAESPLCRFVSNPRQESKAAVLRIVLESYAPFIIFRERLVATGDVIGASRQTKVILNLNAHHDEIKNTLINLGTYSHALITESGGRYRVEETSADNPLTALSQACTDLASAEFRIREQIGESGNSLSRDEVVMPLADALVRIRNNDPRGAVVTAGNAIESFLVALGAQLHVNLTQATGINSKLEAFQRSNHLPRKLVNVGKYLGHIRNAADHGIDTDVNAAWEIRAATGTEFVFVACSFIAATSARIQGRTEI